MRFISKNRVVTLLVGFALLTASFLLVESRAEAACADPNPSFGTVSFNNLTVPESGTYRVWTRMQIPDSAKNNFLIEVNGGTCYTVNGSGSLPANTWTWVDFHGGAASSKINVNLTAGSPFSMRLLGTSEGVLVDRVIFTRINTSGETCTPSGLGNDCAEPIDVQNPTVSMTAPAASPTVLTGTQTVSATATDNNRVKQVEFLLNGTALATPDTTSPYSVQWNTLLTTDGTHTLTARATDDAGNTATTTRQVIVQNGKPDLIVATLSTTPASPKVGDGVTIKATIRNQGAAATVAGLQNVISFSAGGSPITAATYTPAIAPNSTVEITAGATWTAIAGNHRIEATVDSTNKVVESNESNNTTGIDIAVSSPDVTVPTVSITSPANNAANLKGTVNVTANAADNVGGSGVKQVDFYVNSVLQRSVTAAPYTFAWDSTKVADGSHTISVRVQDKAGNISQQTSITVTTDNVTTPPPTPKAGDVDNNGVVEYKDLLAVLNNWGQSGRTREQGELDGKGSVNYSDLLLVLNNWTAK